MGASTSQNPYLDAAVGAKMLALGLPPIRGKWFFVDPLIGSASNDGMTPSTAFASITTAYAACTDGAGDGIAFLSASSGATSYSDKLIAPIEWSKWGITLYGVAAGGYNSRARVVSHAVTTDATFVVAATPQTITRPSGSFIADGWVVGMTGIFDTTDTNSNKTFTVTAVSALVLTGTVGTDDLATDASAVNVLRGYFPYIINVTGSNNRFYNMYIINECTHVLNIGALAVAGNRNKFVNCHFNTVGALQSASADQFDVRVNASENVFDHCWMGNNNVARSGAANGNIVLGLSTTQTGQNFFELCYILSTSTTATHGAIKVANAATLGGYVVFDRCKFINWLSGAETALATIIIGATPNNCGLLLDRCASVGYAAVGANNDKWFTTAAASAAGTGTLALSIN